MNFKLYREYGALNSQPIFDALSRGLSKLGHREVSKNEDIAVIWSVLWKGRMRSNQMIYENRVRLKKPTLIIEVGNLKRGLTWRLGIDHINRDGYFGVDKGIDLSRPGKLGVSLKDFQQKRKSSILICTQLPESLQWQGMPRSDIWLRNLISDLRMHTDRKIVVRPHPRQNFRPPPGDFKLDLPKKLANTYDDFDIDFNHHAVINHNSGPTVQSAINGTPVICHTSGLAYPVSDKLENIENIQLPDREKWFLDLCHTEWTADEIATGEPINRVLRNF